MSKRLKDKFDQKKEGYAEIIGNKRRDPDAHQLFLSVRLRLTKEKVGKKKRAAQKKVTPRPGFPPTFSLSSPTVSAKKSSTKRKRATQK